MGGGLNAPHWSRDSKRILFAAPNLTSSCPCHRARRSPSALPSWRDQVTAWVKGMFTLGVADAHGPPWDFWLVDSNGDNLVRLTQIGEDEPGAAGRRMASTLRLSGSPATTWSMRAAKTSIGCTATADTGAAIGRSNK